MKTSHTYQLNHASVFEQVADLLNRWRERWEAGKKPDLELTVKVHEDNRTVKQNARYWALMNLIAQEMPPHMDGEHHDPYYWHIYFKRRFLGVQTVAIFGDEFPVAKRSRDLYVGPFADYMTQIEAFVAEHGIYLGDL